MGQRGFHAFEWPPNTPEKQKYAGLVSLQIEVPQGQTLGPSDLVRADKSTLGTMFANPLPLR